MIDGAQIPAAKAALADLEERLEQLERDAARLTIVAPAAGTVLPPPNRAAQAAAADKLGTLVAARRWSRESGQLSRNRHAVCLVGDPSRFEAVLHVEQSDIELVQAGQRVRIVLDHLPGEIFWGDVAEIAKLDLKVMPRELAAAGDLPARTDQRGRRAVRWIPGTRRGCIRRRSAHLVARVHGRAKIAVASQSLARNWRAI